MEEEKKSHNESAAPKTEPRPEEDVSMADALAQHDAEQRGEKPADRSGRPDDRGGRPDRGGEAQRGSRRRGRRGGR